MRLARCLIPFGKQVCVCVFFIRQFVALNSKTIFLNHSSVFGQHANWRERTADFLIIKDMEANSAMLPPFRPSCHFCNRAQALYHVFYLCRCFVLRPVSRKYKEMSGMCVLHVSYTQKLPVSSTFAKYTLRLRGVILCLKTKFKSKQKIYKGHND